MNRNKEAYNKISDQWESWRKETRINPCIVRFADRLKPGSSILDIGCGTGYPIDFYLADRGFSVTGIDLSDRMIEKASANAKAWADINSGAAIPRYLCTDFLDYEAEEKFDAILAFDSLWHIPMDKQADIYSHLARLAPEGCLFFTHGRQEGSVTGAMFGQEFFYSALDGERVKNLLCKAGFEVLDWQEDFEEEITGTRDLVVTARRYREGADGENR